MISKKCLTMFTPETKQYSKQRVAPSGSAPKKAKIAVSSAGKVMATVFFFFWDAQGITLIDYL